MGTSIVGYKFENAAPSVGNFLRVKFNGFIVGAMQYDDDYYNSAVIERRHC